MLAELRAAFATGTRLTQLLRLISDGFGPDEFDVSAALPDAPGPRCSHTAARTLADRFGAELERLFTDHRDVFTALTAAGYPLPDELRAPAQLALARRLEADLVDLASGADGLALASAQSVVAEAAEAGVGLDVPVVRVAARRRARRPRAPGGRVRRRAARSTTPWPCSTWPRHAGVLVSRGPRPRRRSTRRSCWRAAIRTGAGAPGRWGVWVGARSRPSGTSACRAEPSGADPAWPVGDGLREHRLPSGASRSLAKRSGADPAAGRRRLAVREPVPRASSRSGRAVSDAGADARSEAGERAEPIRLGRRRRHAGAPIAERSE